MLASYRGVDNPLLALESPAMTKPRNPNASNPIRERLRSEPPSGFAVDGALDLAKAEFEVSVLEQILPDD